METACPDAESKALQVLDLPSYLDREHLVSSRQIVHVPIKKLHVQMANKRGRESLLIVSVASGAYREKNGVRKSFGLSVEMG